jgi:hypothetical protein
MTLNRFDDGLDNRPMRDAREDRAGDIFFSMTKYKKVKNQNSIEKPLNKR